MKKKIIWIGLSLLLFAMPVHAKEQEEIPVSDSGVKYGRQIDTGDANAEGTATWTLYDSDDDGNVDLEVISGSGLAQSGFFSPFKKIYISRLIIEDGITEIGEGRFASYDNLTNVDIPSSVTRIGYRAFHCCYSLSKIIIPGSNTVMGNEVFAECPLLVTAGPQGGNYNIEFGNLKNINIVVCDSLTSIVVPNTVEELFIRGCNNLPSITVPNGVKKLGITYCPNISRIDIPSNVTSIGEEAFIVNASLSSVTIPDSVTSIGKGAFAYCYSLTTITIPASVKTFGDNVFSNCTSLSEIVGYAGSEAEKYAARNNIPFRAIESTVTFDDSNEGGTISSASKTVKYKTAQKYGSFPEVTTKERYSFIGWFTEKTGGTQVTVDSIVPEGDHTLYARWKADAIPFIDVPTDAYYYEPVQWAYTNNITTGVSETEFGPKNSCTRGQVVTFLWRAVGTPEPTVTSCPFTDVSAGKYFYKPVLWAVEKGVTTGTSPTTFSPNGTVSRGQAITLMWRAYGMPSAPASGKFVDVPANAYYAKAVDWAVANGITTGTSANKFSPNGDCIRGQIVTFLYRGYAK